jgi:hypothetical protein
MNFGLKNKHKWCSLNLIYYNFNPQLWNSLLFPSYCCHIFMASFFKVTSFTNVHFLCYFFHDCFLHIMALIGEKQSSNSILYNITCWNAFIMWILPKTFICQPYWAQNMKNRLLAMFNWLQLYTLMCNCFMNTN